MNPRSNRKPSTTKRMVIMIIIVGLLLALLIGWNALGQIMGAQFAANQKAPPQTVSTMKVSSSRPHPMMDPAWIMIAMEPTIRPNMLTAKMMPAEVMTEPVLATVRRTPTRMLRGDSSLSRETRSML